MMQNEVTIGIPVFKAADYIEATLNSALAQTYPNLEILLVDDYGNDGSMDVARRVATTHPRGSIIRMLANDGHQGVGPSRNRLIDNARGRYLYFLDADDLIAPNTIELMVREAIEHRAEMVYASYESIDQSDSNCVKKFQKPHIVFTEPDELAIYAFQHMDVFQTTACNSLIDIQFLRQSGIRFIDTMFWEDLAFTYEVLTQACRAVLLPDITYYYIYHLGSLSHGYTQYQLQKSDIMRNVSTIDYLKSKAAQLPVSRYLPFLCASLEVNSFYLLCYIIKNSERITPPVSRTEKKAIIRHPLPLRRILSSREQLLQNLLFWLLGSLPESLMLPVVFLIGRMKKAI